jgi:hypothetical protein
MSTTVPLDINAIGDLTDLSVQEVWIKSPADLQQYHTDYVYVEPVSDLIVKDSSITAVKAFTKIPEQGSIPASSPNPGFKQTYTQSFFAGMLRITRPMWRYGLEARKLEGVVTQLKNDAIRFREQLLANMVNNMTATSYTDTTGSMSFPVTNSGGDGVSPQSASHTREDGGTNWSNLISDGTTNNLSFDYAGWKAALKTAQAIKGGVGEILDVNVDTILVKKNSSAHHRAEEVLKSIDRGEKPGTANRDGAINRTYNISANPYLTADAAWGAFDSSKVSMQFGFQLKEGMPLSLDPQFIDYDTKEIKYSAGSDFAYGFNDLRNFTLSTGLNA